MGNWPLYLDSFSLEKANSYLLWFAIEGIGGKRVAFLYNIELNEEYQGKGYGKAVMKILEERVKELEISEINLHAFGGNRRAWELYEKIGYNLTNVRMKKEL